MIDLKKIRESHNLTQAQFSKFLGVTQHAVSQLENRKRAVSQATKNLVSLQFKVCRFCGEEKHMIKLDWGYECQGCYADQIPYDPPKNEF